MAYNIDMRVLLNGRDTVITTLTESCTSNELIYILATADMTNQ